MKTLSELLDLTSTPEGLEEIRVMVAELCDISPIWAYVAIPKTVHCDVPRYHESLDAMHELENGLTVKEWNTYCRELEGIVRKQGDETFPEWKKLNPSNVIDALLIRAPAHMRAIAYILTRQETKGAE